MQWAVILTNFRYSSNGPATSEGRSSLVMGALIPAGLIAASSGAFGECEVVSPVTSPSCIGARQSPQRVSVRVPTGPTAMK